MGGTGKHAVLRKIAAPKHSRSSQMKGNESSLDRIIRGILGLALLLVAFLAVPAGALQIVLAIIGVVLLLTGAVGFCPLYRVLGLSTKI